MSKKSDLNDAISEAHEALEDIDNFDLHSDNPTSVSEMDRLTTLHDEAVAKVIALAKEQ